MASKYDIILITLVVVIFSVPTICAEGEKCKDLETFCKNGGTCYTKEDGSPACHCPDGYTGYICDKHMKQGLRSSIKKLIDNISGLDSTQWADALVFTGITTIEDIKYVKYQEISKAPGLKEIKPFLITKELEEIQNALKQQTPKPTMKPTQSTTTKSTQPEDKCRDLQTFCKNGGTCHTKDGNPTCSCPDSYTGYTCANATTPCDSNICMNSGTCIPDAKRLYSCQCQTHFTGKNCETDMQSDGWRLRKRLELAILCANNNTIPRENINMTNLVNGLIYDGVEYLKDLKDVDMPMLKHHMPEIHAQIKLNKFLERLQKMEGFHEKHPQCTPNPCKNGGTCEDVICAFECKCSTEYKGLTCEAKVTSKLQANTTIPVTKTPPVPIPEKNATITTSTNKAATTNKPFQLILYTLCIIAIAALAFLGYSYRQKVRSWVCEDKDTKKGSKNIDYKRLKEEGTNKKMEIEIDRSEGSTYIY